MTSRADKNRKSKPVVRQPEPHEDDNLQHGTSPDLLQNTARQAVPALNPQTILRLQRLIGNQAVQRLLVKRGVGGRLQNAQPAESLLIQSSQSRVPSTALQMRRRLGVAPNSRFLLQRAIKTWAGEWDTNKYETVKNKAGKEIGVEMDLKFHPNEHVNATQIGAVQSIVSFNKGEISLPSGDKKTITDRTIPKGEEGEGTRIDRLAPADSDYGNPLYGTNESSGDAKLGDATTMGNASHGFHYKDEKGKLHEKDATLWDRPTRPARAENANQIFETTALAVGGIQQGTYYGSVQWGWESDAKGDFKQLPLTLKSNDVPTDNFAAASELWNDSKTAKGNDTINLPIVKGKFVNAPGVWLVTDPSKYKTTRTDKLPKDARVEVTDKGEGKPFNEVTDDQYIWWKVTVVDGAAVGKVGWVMQHYLSDAKEMEKAEPGWFSRVLGFLFGL